MTLKPGWRRVKFGEVVQLSKARYADAWSIWSRAICAFAVGATFIRPKFNG